MRPQHAHDSHSLVGEEGEVEVHPGTIVSEGFQCPTRVGAISRENKEDVGVRSEPKVDI